VAGGPTTSQQGKLEPVNVNEMKEIKLIKKNDDSSDNENNLENDSNWNQELFDSIFTEKPKYYQKFSTQLSQNSSSNYGTGSEFTTKKLDSN